MPKAKLDIKESEDVAEGQWEWSGEFCWARKLVLQVPGLGGLGEPFPGTSLQPLADVKGFLLMPADSRG